MNKCGITQKGLQPYECPVDETCCSFKPQADSLYDWVGMNLGWTSGYSYHCKHLVIEDQRGAFGRLWYYITNHEPPFRMSFSVKRRC